MLSPWYLVQGSVITIARPIATIRRLKAIDGNIKLGIFFFFMKSFYSEFCFIVNKGTEWSVFTLVWILKIRTITSLKPVFVIHLFYYVMRVSTILRTILEIAFF